MVILTPTRDMDRTEWLEWRRKGIGSSDAAAVAGLDPYKSPLAVYLEKVGEVTDDEQSEAAYWGLRLEDVLAEEYRRRTGRRVRRRNAILQHPDYPWMLANLDREIVGEPGLLEIKTTSAYLRDQWGEDKAPDKYVLQCQHQMAVTGRQWADLAVLIGGQEFRIVRVHRDEDLIQTLIDIERRFWEEHVVPRIPPEPDGHDVDMRVLASLYPESDPDSIVALPNDAEQLIRQYEDAKAAEAQWAEVRQQAEARLKAMLGNSEVGLCGDRRVVWKTVRQFRVDTKRLKAEQPDVYERYAKESAYRRFQIQ